MRKKLILAGTISGALIFGILAAMIALDSLVESISQKAIAIITTPAAGAAKDIQNVSYGEVGLQPFRAIAWQDLNAELSLGEKSKLLPNAILAVHLDNLEIKLAHPLARQFVVVASGISLSPVGKLQLGDDLPELYTTLLQEGTLTLPLTLNSWSPKAIKEQLRQTIGAARELVRSGSTTLEMTFTATSQFKVNKEPVTAKLSLLREEGRSALILDHESLLTLSKQLREELTPAEVELLARNPFRAPALLQIRNEAQKVAKEEHQKAATTPEDAYRHILWSYLLTKSYGPEFAQKATDAHELGASNNSEAEQRMDYKNNEIGRRYAEEKYRRGELLSRLLKDPEVVLAPR